MTRDRILTQTAMALLAALSCVAARWLKPEINLAHVLTLGLGYFSLAALVITLLIGPWQMLRGRRRTPVNINLRRDIAIWAGITGLLHVIFGFQIHLGGNILHYFFRPDSWMPLLNPFGASNVLGLAATILLALLLILSNDLSVRLLHGKRWKQLQRLNYILFGLVVLHTWGYQYTVQRPWIMVVLSVALTGVVLVMQLRGYRFYRLHWPQPSARGSVARLKNSAR